MKKIKKVKTSISIDPELLQQVRDIVADPNSAYKSVSHFVECALREFVSKSV
jgi:Arc/MetJ-type ribon-helix-helix transcriptional regulator